MKLIAHAGLFAMGAIQVDTETGEWSFLTEPLVNSDIGVSSPNGQSFTPEDATKAGNLVLSALNQAAGKWILKQMGIEIPKAKEPIPLTNVLGGTGKASA